MAGFVLVNTRIKKLLHVGADHSIPNFSNLYIYGNHPTLREQWQLISNINRKWSVHEVDRLFTNKWLPFYKDVKLNHIYSISEDDRGWIETALREGFSIESLTSPTLIYKDITNV